MKRNSENYTKKKLQNSGKVHKKTALIRKHKMDQNTVKKSAKNSSRKLQNSATELRKRNSPKNADNYRRKLLKTTKTAPN